MVLWSGNETSDKAIDDRSRCRRWCIARSVLMDEEKSTRIWVGELVCHGPDLEQQPVQKLRGRGYAFRGKTCKSPLPRCELFARRSATLHRTATNLEHAFTPAPCLPVNRRKVNPLFIVEVRA